MKEKVKKEIDLKEVDRINEYKKRMLTWHSPVEYVNNMYGSHGEDPPPHQGGYFSKIYKD